MGNPYPSTVTGQLLENPRFEVLPTASVGDQVREHLPAGRTVTVTASAGRGLGATLDLSCELARDGYDVVPHLAARMVSGRAELTDLVARLSDAGVTSVFVPGGDAEPAGDYHQALDLLADLSELEHPFTQVGVTGYPESHPHIDDDVAIQAMWDKRTLSTHIVSNMTFDSEQVGSWAERVRRRGVHHPLFVGVPGPVERTKLLGMATKIGVGESMRFLAKQKGIFARIAAPGFSTDRFVARIGALANNNQLNIAGLHLFTFNQVGVTETWRRAQLGHAHEV